jgi:chromosome segregation ATPase
LGRSKHISEFVKHGTERAMIEITLKSSQQNETVTLRRKFGREDNTSEWCINGKSTTLKDVLTLTKSLHIQVDNLW